MRRYCASLPKGCSNKEIAGSLNISPRTVKQHLRTLFLRGNHRRPEAGEVSDRRIREGADGIMQPRDQLTTKEIQVTTLVWEGLTNREIAKIVGTTEQVIKNYLRTAFDKFGVWSRLELALYVASHGGADWAAQRKSSIEGAMASSTDNSRMALAR